MVETDEERLMTWLLILGGFKRVLSTIVDWITHASFWQLVSLGLAILAIIQHFQTIEARHDAAKWQRQYGEVKAKLDSVSSKRNDQKVVTKTRIETVTRTIHDADGQAKKVETAPLPGGCKTPPQVLGADL